MGGLAGDPPPRWEPAETWQHAVIADVPITNTVIADIAITDIACGVRGASESTSPHRRQVFTDVVIR
jgi:hypothetical protein